MCQNALCERNKGMLKRKKTVLWAMIALLCLTSCKKREAVSAEVFNRTMEEQGYEIADATNQIQTEYVEAISLAQKDGYQIEFYVFSDAKAAFSVFGQNKSLFEEYKGAGSFELSKDIGNYHFYSLTTNGMYYLLSQVDNTMCYVVADAEYKAEIADIIKFLGYE